jgi:hypothetical protein
MTTESAASAKSATGPQAAIPEQGVEHVVVLSPADEAARAIEETHRLLTEAAEHATSDEADRLAEREREQQPAKP